MIKNQNEVLHKPFDLETHKKTFINYLEIVIDSKGICHYAVPSHNGILEQLVCKKHNIKYNLWDFNRKASDLCPKERYADYYEWLCEETGCIMVWGIPYSHIVGKPNEKQKEMLEILKKEGLY